MLVGAVADRRDFYHQFATSYQKASTNTVYPAFKFKDFNGTRAYEQYCLDFCRRKGAPSENHVLMMMPPFLQLLVRSCKEITLELRLLVVLMR